jgi:hypothetical protein
MPLGERENEVVAVEGAHGAESKRRRWTGAIVRVAVLVVVALAAHPSLLDAQESGALLGTVTDGVAPVYAASVTVLAGDRVVATAETDRAGRFALPSLAAGTYELKVERLGYATLAREVAVAAGSVRVVDLVLLPIALVVEGVSVEAARARARARFDEFAGITVRELSGEALRRVPGVAEADPLRAVGVLPGVVSTSDFSSAFHVRGGSQDQNLVLLDGAPVFSPFHLGGFFSVFNADMVERAELASGGFPAAYGGRVSSVLTVVSDPGDGRFAVDGGVSLLAARAAVAGGGLGGALRWRVSGRRSYFDKLLGPFFEFPYHLDDLQGVAEFASGPRDRFRVSLYRGADVLALTRLDPEDFPLRVDWRWGNDVAGLSWDRLLARGRLRTNASWSRFGSKLLFPDFDDTEFSNSISQWSVGTSLEWRLSPWLRTTTGARVETVEYENLARSGGTEFGQGEGRGRQGSIFAQGEWGFPGRWLVESGLRLDDWAPDGERGVTVLSPRLAGKRFFRGGGWAVKATVGRYAQFLHSLRDEELPLGIDVWTLAGDRAPRLVSDQVQVGIEAYPDDRWSWSLEAYVRTFDGVVAFNTADDPNTEADDILAGDGTSWGADLLVRRDGGGVDGWLALSFLKADRTFPDPLAADGSLPEVSYPPIFDRRLDLDLMLRLPEFRGWDVGMRLNVGTGVPYTRPLAGYVVYQPRFLRDGGRFTWGADQGDDGSPGSAVVLGPRNGARYPVYHRLDLSLRREYRKSWGAIAPHVDVLNLLNRRNVLFYFYEFDRDPPVRSGISMFPLLPTVGVEIRFR